MIDPHVHLRGEEYNTNYMKLGFEHAKKSGLIAIMEHPNPNPKLTNAENIRNRLKKGKRYRRKISHGIHMGITNDENQVRQALEAVQRGDCGLVSDKTFYVDSTGNMGILDEDFQKRLWEIKAEMGYKEVSIGHFEDEKEFNVKFNPEYPVTHSQRQNSGAELVQVERQVRNAMDAGFKGIFYVAHVSNPDTIYFLRSMEGKVPFEIATEVTWHHMFLNTDDYLVHKNRVKMNPPLRFPNIQEELLEYVLSGKVTLIGSDHAPHDLTKKDHPKKPSSGIPAIPFWPKGVELLKRYGIKDRLLRQITFDNANRIFKLGLEPKEITTQYDPSLWEAYGFNPFSRIDGS